MAVGEPIECRPCWPMHGSGVGMRIGQAGGCGSVEVIGHTCSRLQVAGDWKMVMADGGMEWQSLHR